MTLTKKLKIQTKFVGDRVRGFLCAGDERGAKYEEEGPRGEKERKRKIEEMNKERGTQRKFTGDERKKGVGEITGKTGMKGTTSDSRKGIRA